MIWYGIAVDIYPRHIPLPKQSRFIGPVHRHPRVAAVQFRDLTIGESDGGPKPNVAGDVRLTIAEVFEDVRLIEAEIDAVYSIADPQLSGRSLLGGLWHSNLIGCLATSLENARLGLRSEFVPIRQPILFRQSLHNWISIIGMICPVEFPAKSQITHLRRPHPSQTKIFQFEAKFYLCEKHLLLHNTTYLTARHTSITPPLRPVSAPAASPAPASGTRRYSCASP